MTPYRRWVPAVIAGAIAAAYSRSLRGPFVLDDITSIRDNPTIRSLWPPWAPLSPPTGEGLTPNGRPLVNLSLAINHALGGNAVWGYHLFNLLIHVLAALALYGLVRRTLGRTMLAAAAALIWGLHPLQTESVTYIVQRAESMMGLFYLLTLYCFVRGWPVRCCLACLCGMAIKEVMVSAPLIVLLYDRTFCSGSFREAWRRHRRLYAGLAATWIVLAYEVAITGNRGGTAGFGAHVAWWRYALTQFPAIAHYLRLCFWPFPLVFDYGMGLAQQELRVVPAALIVLVLLAITIVALVRRPALGFAGAWFFAVLAPTSSFVPVATQTMAEHRMYLPLAPVAVLAAWCALTLRRELAWGLLSAAFAFGALTFRRNRDYRSNLALWEGTVQSYPRNMRALYNLGVSLTEAGRIEEAVRDYETVVRVQPDYIDAHHNLANSLVKLGRVEESLVHYEIAASAHPKSSDIQCSLGIALLDTGRVEPAIKHLQEALRLEPGLTEAHYQLGEALLRENRAAEALPHLQSAAHDRPDSAQVQNALGNACFQTGDQAAAARAYAAAVRLDPKSAEARNNLGNLLLRSGQIAAAVAQFRAAIAAEPGFAPAHNNLGDALLESGRIAGAIGEYQAAVRLKPSLADGHYNLANALAKAGRAEEAAAEYREVIKIDPSHAQAHNNLGIALVRLGRMSEAEREFEQALRLKPDYADARDNLARLRQLQSAP